MRSLCTDRYSFCGKICSAQISTARRARAATFEQKKSLRFKISTSWELIFEARAKEREVSLQERRTRKTSRRRPNLRRPARSARQKGIGLRSCSRRQIWCCESNQDSSGRSATTRLLQRQLRFKANAARHFLFLFSFFFFARICVKAFVAV